MAGISPIFNFGMNLFLQQWKQIENASFFFCAMKERKEKPVFAYFQEKKKHHLLLELILD